MPTIIPVKFTYAARDLWFDPAGTGAQEADHVICSTERGTEIGLATADAREVSEEELEHVIGQAQLRSVVRIATDSDLERAEQLAARGEDAMPTFRRLVGASGLDMKPVGVEYLFDGEKAVCYFAAEERVDFRQLVRDLSRELHVRIDMRQIGVREEAAIVGGYGHCGQELCCRRFNMSFDPVSIRMAKEQDLPLNSTKISGACGRLMCCLRYEFEAYRDFKGRAPKRNAVIDTPLGKGKIIEYDTPKEQICLRLESGKQIRVALADMTASEAACKKSKELGCACRPDTVTREVLDRLDSPDVQMALAELDRKNGMAPEQTVDAADIFVSTRRKRRRSDDGGNASDSASGARGNQPGEKDNRPQHMRGGGQGQAAGEDGQGVSNAVRAAHLAKADLISQAVVEFTSQQGVMGGYYAEAAGEPADVCAAIREHYRPRFAGDELPSGTCGKCVAIADKLDTACGIFAIHEPPTGSSDPYAVRRAAIGIIAMLRTMPSVHLKDLIALALSSYAEQGLEFDAAAVQADVEKFFLGRLAAIAKEEGVAPDAIEAVSSVGVIDPAEFLARAEALDAARSEQPELFDDLATAYARAHNLADTSLGCEVDTALLGESERALLSACEQGEQKVVACVEDSDFAGACSALAELREPIDRFFEDVLVMDEDTKVRENRLRLLNRFASVFADVANIGALSRKK